MSVLPFFCLLNSKEFYKVMSILSSDGLLSSCVVGIEDEEDRQVKTRV